MIIEVMLENEVVDISAFDVANEKVRVFWSFLGYQPQRPLGLHSPPLSESDTTLGNPSAPSTIIHICAHMYRLVRMCAVAHTRLHRWAHWLEPDHGAGGTVLCTVAHTVVYTCEQAWGRWGTIARSCAYKCVQLCTSIGGGACLCTCVHKIVHICTHAWG